MIRPWQNNSVLDNADFKLMLLLSIYPYGVNYTAFLLYDLQQI